MQQWFTFVPAPNPSAQPAMPTSRTTAVVTAAPTATANETRLSLWIAFDYGGRAELVEAARRIVESGVDAQEIDEGLLPGCQLAARYLPATDGDRVYAVIRGSAVNNDGDANARFTRASPPCLRRMSTVLSIAASPTSVDTRSTSAPPSTATTRT